MVVKIIVGVLLVAVLGFAGTYWFVCPCERIPGGPLSGEDVTESVDDWSFVNDRNVVRLCEVEVDAVLPHSVTVNCMSTGGALYVSCSRCDGKYWSSKALANPAGYVKADGRVYPITYRRVTDETELDEVWMARAAKVGMTEVRERPDHWWTFNLASRE